MNQKVKAALAENPEIAAYLRWGVLIFGIAVSWATLKADVKQLAHDQEQSSDGQSKFNQKVDTFIESANGRNENQAGWYERLSRNEREVMEMRRELAVLMTRTRTMPPAYYPPPEPEEPAWRSDPRRP